MQASLESDQCDMEQIMLGLPRHDADFERYRAMLSNKARLRIPRLCYNLMASIG